TKPLGCYGDGGAIFTADPERAALYRSIRLHGLAADREAERAGVTGRLDTIQAAVRLAKLTCFDAEIAARERIAAIYDEHLRGLCTLPPRDPACRSVWAQYSLLVEDRDARAAAINEAGVATAIYYAK